MYPVTVEKNSNLMYVLAAPTNPINTTVIETSEKDVTYLSAITLAPYIV